MTAAVFSGAACGAGLTLFAWFVARFCARRIPNPLVGGPVAVVAVLLAYAAVIYRFAP
jgi:putative effector of murein hydrolase